MESEFIEDNYDDNFTEMSPVEIAEELFSKEPSGITGSKQIIPHDSEYNTSMIFEILLTIYMEGLTLIDNINLQKITINDLLKPNRWFNDLGFNINVLNFDRNDDNKHNYSDQYCKIVLKHSDPFIFELKNIDSEYTFLLNGIYKDNCEITKIEKLFALFTTNNTVYKISFNFKIT